MGWKLLGNLASPMFLMDTHNNNNTPQNKRNWRCVFAWFFNSSCLLVAHFGTRWLLMILMKQIFILEREYQATFCLQAEAAKHKKKSPRRSGVFLASVARTM